MSYGCYNKLCIDRLYIYIIEDKIICLEPVITKTSC